MRLLFCILLFLFFLTLQLNGVIAWSWWIVTAPLWVPLVIDLIVLTMGLTFVCILLVLGGIIAIALEYTDRRIDLRKFYDK
jgi:hypothetical protein